MFFSVLIPVYNAEEYIDECIASVINQTEKDFEMEESVWIPLNDMEQWAEHCSSWLINLLRHLEKGHTPVYLGTEYIA